MSAWLTLVAVLTFNALVASLVGATVQWAKGLRSPGTRGGGNRSRLGRRIEQRIGLSRYSDTPLGHVSNQDHLSLSTANPPGTDFDFPEPDLKYAPRPPAPVFDFLLTLFWICIFTIYWLAA